MTVACEPTADEVRLLELTALLWNALKELPPEHPEERDDLRRHVHAVQDIVAARATYRYLKELNG